MISPESYEFFSPVKFNSGNRALDHIPIELDNLNSRKPLVVTNKKASDGGVVGKFHNALKDSNVTFGIFDGVPDDPDLEVVTKLANIYRNSDCDSIVAIGAGPVVDVAKIVNIAVSYNIQALDKLAGENLITHPVEPFVLIPLLPATGYEASKYARIGNLTYSSHMLMPDIVVIDPRMLTRSDVQTTISTAMVALTQAAEAYTGQIKNPVSEVYAYAAIRNVVQNLGPVAARRGDVEGRLALANALCMAGCAFSNGKVGAAYAMGETMGTMFHLPPGICMGIVLPYALACKALKETYSMSRLLLPLAGFDSYARTAENLRTDAAINMIIDMQHDLHNMTGGKMPRTLEEAKIPKYMLQDITERVCETGSDEFTYKEYQAVLEHAWEGKPLRWEKT